MARQLRVDYPGAVRRVGRCIAMLALVGAAYGVVNAQNAARWSWQEAQATVLPTGDLEWAPRPFVFKAGASVRYIDFDSGNDANDGLSRQTPWKHHPWDPNAGGKAAACKGVQTYVFKQGVVYRGEMNAKESGAADAPIILTRDPSWGEGPAVLCGSEAVTGWKKGADNNLIPEPEKVWHVDLEWAPRNVWMVGKDGAVTRIALARTPNWTITDPDDIKSQWWTWKNPDKPFDNYATINGQRRHLAFDKEDINESKPQDYYEGAILWTTKGWVMGNPFPARVLAADRKNGSLTFPGQWGGAPAYKIIRGCRFYLEDKPHYLDSPGEFWFDKKGDGGRLYLRLPGDQDPNSARVEVARRIHIIESTGMSHVHIRGLTFRFANVYWNLTASPYWVSHESIDVEPGCVRLLGSGTDIEVANCLFEHVHKGVRLKAVGRQDAIDKVVVDDNVFSDTDSGGVELADSSTYGDVDPPMGRLYDVRVMRNRFDHVGIRPDLFNQGAALRVDYAQTAEVAGNFFERVCAQGIDVHGAKPNSAATDRPFARILIHHNKVVDSLLNVDDFGGIETWQGGPAYVYDNISGNPGCYRNWDHVLNPNAENRFGHAYYLDGGFKNYHFNNIAWGKSKGPAGKLANTSAFQQIISYQNTFFNNTIYNFVRGSRRQDPQAGRDKFLGNVWQSMGLRVFRDADPANTEAAGNEADAGPRRDQYAIDTDAYARNVFYDVGQSFGVFEPSGRWHRTLESFREALESYKPLAATVGVMAGQPPLLDPAAHDFRPSANSPARGQGAKVFVPWSLYETVGEWNFCPIRGDPARILDEHWCMSPYYTERDDYYKFPTYPLKGVNVTLKDYQNGPLENWTTGALRFNGRDQYAVLANQDINRAVVMGRPSGARQRTVSGADLSSPQIYTPSFLIEACFQTAPAQGEATLIQKMDGAGYALRVNQAGGVTLAAQAAGGKAALASHSLVNDGQWHHVIAEADRKAGTFTIYIDGKQDASGPGLGAEASLANDADLYVGGSPQGHNLNGAIDFLRLARGTLADAKTTIQELYAWEFHGPFLYDFTGRERPADGGEAGAIDLAPVKR
ncbi:MAG: LamG-like jellyroll fold domain-containing protein [Limisphaerales bacterium]